MDMDTDMDASNITLIPTPSGISQEPLIPDRYDDFRGTRTPLIIDNGSTTLRWGFGTSPTPHTGPNVVSKYRERKTNRPLVLFGEAVEIDSMAKAQQKAAWEGDVLLGFDALENALDYAFLKLGIDTPGGVEHPVLMTERLASPLHSRTLTSELMFEQYSVPSLAYCVDGIMSFYQNNGDCRDGLVLSFNTASTSVIPILKGKGILSHAKRIPWGPSQASDYLLKLIQLKYPNFPTRVTPPQSNWMFQTFCSFSTDYTSLLRSFTNPSTLRASDAIVQFPFALPAGSEEKTQEEVERIAERRKEQGRKLQEMAAERRVAKLAEKESDLQALVDLKESKTEQEGGRREWLYRLQEEGFDDEAMLDEAIKKLDADIRKARKKEPGEGDDPMEEPSFPLVDVPDAQLDEEGLKEKKKQKLMKAGFEARTKARLEKQREREEKEREERLEEEERETDLGAWSRKMRQGHETLMTRIKERTRRKAALSDRKSAAAQARMKSIAHLASDERVPKKKRKAGGGLGADSFGANDADWAIYRKINTAIESSDEEEDMNQLQTIERKLLAHDPTFKPEHTHAALTVQKSALLTAFRPAYEEGDMEGLSRIHLNTERARVCEAWFSPGMAGVDSAGLGEVIQNILSRFDEADKGRLVKNVYLTGTACQLPGLIPRLHSTLRPILAPEMRIEVVRAADPALDAWRGMAKFSGTEEFGRVGMSRAEYLEEGGERVKRWWGGNWSHIR